MGWEFCDYLVLLNQDFTAQSVKIYAENIHTMVHSGFSDVDKIVKTASEENVLFLFMRGFVVHDHTAYQMKKHNLNILIVLPYSLPP